MFMFGLLTIRLRDPTFGKVVPVFKAFVWKFVVFICLPNVWKAYHQLLKVLACANPPRNNWQSAPTLGRQCQGFLVALAGRWCLAEAD